MMQLPTTDHNRNSTCCCCPSSSSCCSSPPTKCHHHHHHPHHHPVSSSHQHQSSRSWRGLPSSLPFAWAAAAVGSAALLCFAGSVVGGEFVFDDSEAIVNNVDLRPDTPWSNAFRNDFWGTRLTHNTSHKSYRPLTVLSFRLNRVLSGGDLHPFGFRLTNVLLHCLVSILLLPTFSLLTEEPFSCGFGFSFGSGSGSGRTSSSSGSTVSRNAFVCALLFAVHPVHTESVAGVVGRADLLCALFFFLAFLAYDRACKSGLEGYRPSRFSLPLVLVSVTLCAVSMLCKEQGITAIGLCSAYDVIVVCRVDFGELLGLNFLLDTNSSSSSSSSSPSKSHYGGGAGGAENKWVRPLLWRHVILLAAGSVMLATRWHVMGSSPPTFHLVDNPASFADSFYERTINYNYVYALNAWLLVAPMWLCFDWSMGCIPLIRSALDFRVVIVLVFWIVVAAILATTLLRPPSTERRWLTISLALLVVPFLPASNLFFRVGFVIAERVLYISSAGFCLLVVLGVKKLSSLTRNPKVIHASLAVLVLTFIVRCVQRSSEWRSEELLFHSGARVCPLNAKVHYNIAKNAADAGNRWLAIDEYKEAIRLNPSYDQAMNNLANILKDQGELDEAERLLEAAIVLRSDFAAAWMNLGIVQSSRKKHTEAERSYLTAIAHRRQYPDCYYNLGNLYLDQNRYDDAYRAWRNATRLKPTHVVSWNNMIIMLDSTGELDKAKDVGLEALQILPHEPSLHFNLANALGKSGYYGESEKHFLEAIRHNAYSPTYYVNLGVLYHRWRRYGEAERAYRRALQLSPGLKSATENLALLLHTVAKQDPTTSS